MLITFSHQNNHKKTLKSTLHTPQSFRELLRQERARVHRRGLQFSLILFRLADHADLSKVVQPVMVPAILKRIRDIDQLGIYDARHIGLLLPHTAGEGARKIAEDLYRSEPIAANITDYDFYVYP